MSRRYPENVATWWFKEFVEQLPEYSMSVPTGVVRGKRWRMNRNVHQPKASPDWWMGEYGDDAPEDLASSFQKHNAGRMVTIRWTKVYFRPDLWTRNAPVNGLYLLAPPPVNGESAGGPIVHVEVVEGWASTPDEDPDGDRYWCNYFACDLEDVYWYPVRRECNVPGCIQWVREPGFLRCDECIKKSP